MLLRLAGLLLAGDSAGEALRVEGNADLVLGLLLDRLPTEGDGVLELLNRRVLSSGELPLLPPLLLLQLVSFSALVRVPAGDRVLVTKRDARVKRAGGEGTRTKISGNSTHVFFGVAGERASWLGTLPVPVMGNLGGALWAGGGGSRGPAIAVSRAASAVGGARTAA